MNASKLERVYVVLGAFFIFGLIGGLTRFSFRALESSSNAQLILEFGVAALALGSVGALLAYLFPKAASTILGLVIRVGGD